MKLQRTLMSLSLCLFTVVTVTVTATATAADTARGEALADGCTSCHGVLVASQGHIPSINQMSRVQFITALNEYREQKRTATIMNRIARTYTPEEIEQLADYFTQGLAP